MPLPSLPFPPPLYPTHSACARGIAYTRAHILVQIAEYRYISVSAQICGICSGQWIEIQTQ